MENDHGSRLHHFPHKRSPQSSLFSKYRYITFLIKSKVTVYNIMTISTIISIFFKGIPESVRFRLGN